MNIGPIVCLETYSINYQVTRRGKARNWRWEWENFIVGKQKL